MVKDDDVGPGTIFFGLSAVSFVMYTIYDILGGYRYIVLALLIIIGLIRLLMDMQSGKNIKKTADPTNLRDNTL